MDVIKNENVVFVDVDGTLVLPLTKKSRSPNRKVDVYDSITKKFIKMEVHEPNVRLLVEEHHRGSYVIVWSRGGFQWAANVVKALDLTPKVDLVLTKPLLYIDDLKINEWLKYRVFLDANARYKR